MSRYGATEEGEETEERNVPRPSVGPPQTNSPPNYHNNDGNRPGGNQRNMQGTHGYGHGGGGRGFVDGRNDRSGSRSLGAADRDRERERSRSPQRGNYHNNNNAGSDRDWQNRASWDQQQQRGQHPHQQHQQRRPDGPGWQGGGAGARIGNNNYNSNNNRDNYNRNNSSSSGNAGDYRMDNWQSRSAPRDSSSFDEYDEGRRPMQQPKLQRQSTADLLVDMAKAIGEDDASTGATTDVAAMGIEPEPNPAAPPPAPAPMPAVPRLRVVAAEDGMDVDDSAFNEVTVAAPLHAAAAVAAPAVKEKKVRAPRLSLAQEMGLVRAASTRQSSAQSIVHPDDVKQEPVTAATSSAENKSSPAPFAVSALSLPANVPLPATAATAAVSTEKPATPSSARAKVKWGAGLDRALPAGAVAEVDAVTAVPKEADSRTQSEQFASAQTQLALDTARKSAPPTSPLRQAPPGTSPRSSAATTTSQPANSTTPVPATEKAASAAAERRNSPRSPELEKKRKLAASATTAEPDAAVHTRGKVVGTRDKGKKEEEKELPKASPSRATSRSPARKRAKEAVPGDTAPVVPAAKVTSPAAAATHITAAGSIKPAVVPAAAAVVKPTIAVPSPAIKAAEAAVRQLPPVKPRPRTPAKAVATTAESSTADKEKEKEKEKAAAAAAAVVDAKGVKKEETASSPRTAARTAVARISLEKSTPVAADAAKSAASSNTTSSSSAAPATVQRTSSAGAAAPQPSPSTAPSRSRPRPVAKVEKENTPAKSTSGRMWHRDLMGSAISNYQELKIGTEALRQVVDLKARAENLSRYDPMSLAAPGSSVLGAGPYLMPRTDEITEALGYVEGWQNFLWSTVLDMRRKQLLLEEGWGLAQQNGNDVEAVKSEKPDPSNTAVVHASASSLTSLHPLSSSMPVDAISASVQAKWASQHLPLARELQHANMARVSHAHVFSTLIEYQGSQHVQSLSNVQQASAGSLKARLQAATVSHPPMYSTPEEAPGFAEQKQRLLKQRALISVGVRAKKMATRRAWEELGDRYLEVLHKWEAHITDVETKEEEQENSGPRLRGKFSGLRAGSEMGVSFDRSRQNLGLENSARYPRRSADSVVDPAATDEFGVKMSNGGSGLLGVLGIGGGDSKGHWSSDILTTDLDQDRLLQELLKKESMEQRIKRGAATVVEMLNPWPVSDIYKAPRAPEWPEELRKFQAERAEAAKKLKEKEELEQRQRKKRERARERERERSLARLAASKIRREKEAKAKEEAAAAEDADSMNVEAAKESAEPLEAKPTADATTKDVTAASAENSATADVPAAISTPAPVPGSAAKSAVKEEPTASIAAADAGNTTANVAKTMSPSEDEEDEEEEEEEDSSEEGDKEPEEELKPFATRLPGKYPAYQRVPSEMIDVIGRRKTTDGMKQRCANLPCGDRGMGPEGPKDIYGNDAYPKRFLTWKCPADCNCSRTVDSQSRYNRIWTDMEKSIYLDKFVQYPKNFHKISSFLVNRTTRDCIKLYYDSKTRINYKALLKEHDSRRRQMRISWTQALAASANVGSVIFPLNPFLEKGLRECNGHGGTNYGAGGDNNPYDPDHEEQQREALEVTTTESFVELPASDMSYHSFYNHPPYQSMALDIWEKPAPLSAASTGSKEKPTAASAGGDANDAMDADADADEVVADAKAPDWDERLRPYPRNSTVLAGIRRLHQLRQKKAPTSTDYLHPPPPAAVVDAPQDKKSKRGTGSKDGAASSSSPRGSPRTTGAAVAVITDSNRHSSTPSGHVRWKTSSESHCSEGLVSFQVLQQGVAVPVAQITSSHLMQSAAGYASNFTALSDPFPVMRVAGDTRMRDKHFGFEVLGSHQRERRDDDDGYTYSTGNTPGTNATTPATCLRTPAASEKAESSGGASDQTAPLPSHGTSSKGGSRAATPAPMSPAAALKTPVDKKDEKAKETPVVVEKEKETHVPAPATAVSVPAVKVEKLEKVPTSVTAPAEGASTPAAAAVVAVLKATLSVAPAPATAAASTAPAAAPMPVAPAPEAAKTPAASRRERAKKRTPEEPKKAAAVAAAAASPAASKTAAAEPSAPATATSAAAANVEPTKVDDAAVVASPAMTSVLPAPATATPASAEKEQQRSRSAAKRPLAAEAVKESQPPAKAPRGRSKSRGDTPTPTPKELPAATVAEEAYAATSATTTATTSATTTATTTSTTTTSTTTTAAAATTSNEPFASLVAEASVAPFVEDLVMQVVNSVAAPSRDDKKTTTAASANADLSATKAADPEVKPELSGTAKESGPAVPTGTAAAESEAVEGAKADDADAMDVE